MSRDMLKQMIFQVRKNPIKLRNSTFPELAMLLESDGNSIIVCDIVSRYSNLKNKIKEVNNHLALMCGQRYGFLFQNLDLQTLET